MSWQDAIHLVPSHNMDLLRSLLGRQITGLVHLASEAPGALLANDAYAARRVVPSALFSRADGPVVLAVDGVAPVAIVGSEELVSVTIEPADEQELAEDWDARIDAVDPANSEPRFARALGRAVIGIRVLRRIAEGRLGDRPCEIGVVLHLDDGSELIFSNGLVDAPNNFAVLTGDDIRDGADVPYREIARLP